jgi:hypothetical protein
MLKDGALATGQYLVVKYRAPEQLGSIQIYTSTQNASASDAGSSLTIKGDNGLFIGDGKWHIVIIDLSKVLRTYVADANGKFVAKHLRVDLFNFNKPLEGGARTYTDIAYVGLCDDYNEILGSDTSVEKILFFDGTSPVEVPNEKK